MNTRCWRDEVGPCCRQSGKHIPVMKERLLLGEATFRAERVGVAGVSWCPWPW